MINGDFREQKGNNDRIEQSKKKKLQYRHIKSACLGMGKGAVLLILLLYFRSKKYVLCIYQYTVRMFHVNIRQDKNNSNCAKQFKNTNTQTSKTPMGKIALHQVHTVCYLHL